MAASLLRLHFHDCFVKGCDASLLLDSSGTITSEKRSNPNRNSARGFEVVDEIKAALEKECPRTVSCADILALAARDSTVLTGGPSWEVPLGRRDSIGASIQGSNNNIPAPNNTLQTIITKFKLKDLDTVDLVALSGSHTIGDSRCTSFRQRLYNQTGDGRPDSTLDATYAAQLRRRCPRSGGDQNLFPLDALSPGRLSDPLNRPPYCASSLFGGNVSGLSRHTPPGFYFLPTHPPTLSLPLRLLFSALRSTTNGFLRSLTLLWCIVPGWPIEPGR
ncbi:hypothetical protein OPV22_008897 [Ensete ventricosum]|uniref:Plant heme peroxidase family profile domain-containing protein n=1 Tax=Ensete ventricosum TaxID=4639 RepID=A0AAV8R9T7_ENSVE|nr:hypothetical protein OPV22_008897 [Ensete ventricosum]